MKPPPSRLRRAAATAALLAPFAWIVLLAARDVGTRPTGRTPLAPPLAPAQVRLDVGARLRVELPPDRAAYRAILLHVAAPREEATSAEVRVCRERACEVQVASARAGDPLRLDLPGGTGPGAVDVTVIRATGGAIVVAGSGGAAGIEALQGYSWALPVRSARAMFAAMVGADALVPALLAWLAALGAVAMFALWRAWRGRGASP